MFDVSCPLLVSISSLEMEAAVFKSGANRLHKSKCSSMSYVYVYAINVLLIQML